MKVEIHWVIVVTEGCSGWGSMSLLSRASGAVGRSPELARAWLTSHKITLALRNNRMFEIERMVHFLDWVFLKGIHGLNFPRG